MGDQTGSPVDGIISYIRTRDIECILAADIETTAKSEIFANICRINVLYMIARAGSGHLGSSFSSLDIVSQLLLNEVFSSEPELSDAIYFSSKGHDVPGLYSGLIGLGKLEQSLIHKLRRLNGLPGHPDISIPFTVTNTGSLGMGVSKAKGMVKANRLSGLDQKIYLLTGDGELQEGQFWESLPSAANHKMGEITVIVDHNKIQSDTKVEYVNSLGDLEGKFEKFGWDVYRCDGHDHRQLADVLQKVKVKSERPKCVIADTIKGYGVSFMEKQPGQDELYQYHSGALSNEEYFAAFRELSDSLRERLYSAGLSEPEYQECTSTAIRPKKEDLQSLIMAYENLLPEYASRDSRIVALDADLILDTGLVSFKRIYPERFIECGIAEQDMVSQAGSLALKGFLPFVHSFACFLSSRAAEQMYNNATEKTKIVYVGSLAGVIPGGPGHSHQSLRDIALMASLPGMTVLEPSCEKDLENILDYVANDCEQSAYIRLVSIGVDIPYGNEHCHKLVPGTGSILSRVEKHW